MSGKQKHKKGPQPSQQKAGNAKPSAGFVLPRYYYWIGLAAAILFSVYIRNNFLEIPFERDEGAYTYTGKILLEGAIPFKDIGSQRLPGVFYAYAVMVWLFGYSMEAMHVGFIFINVITILIMYFLAKALFDELTALVTAIAFVLMSMIPDAYGFTTQSEHLVAITGFAGLLVLVHFFKKERWYLLIASGLLLSMAFQIKQTSMFYCVFSAIIFVYHYLGEKPMRWKPLFINGTLFFVSFLVPIAFSIFMVWYQGAWADFNIWFFEVSKVYTGVISFSDGLGLMVDAVALLFKGYEYLWLLSAIGVVLVFYTDASRYIKLFVSALYVLCYFTVVPGNHYYGHYFLQFTPAVALAIGVSVWAMIRIFQRKPVLRRWAYILPVSLFVFAVGSNLNKKKDYYFDPNFYQLLRAVYGINPFPEAKVIADKLNSVMKEDDQIAVLGTEIEMYVYTNRNSPSRFCGPGALVEFPVPQSKEWQREFMRDVEKAEPRFLIFFANKYSWMQHPKAENLLEPWFNKFANEKYFLYGTADMYSNITRWQWHPNIDMVNNPPKSDYKVYVFEKKPVTPVP